MSGYCEACAEAQAQGFLVCSFHRVSHLDFDGCDKHPLKVVHLVPADPDETDW